MPKLELTSHERSALRASAHSLRPVVLIGDRGLTDAVLKEIDLNLKVHELIKVRAGTQERDDREVMLNTICDTLSCAPVHHLGKTLILYRPKPAQELITRAVRKPNQPYTPKKQAALDGERSRQKRTGGKASAAPAAKASKPFAPPKARPAGPREAGPATARRSGSALSLRAGIRRNLGPRSSGRR